MRHEAAFLLLGDLVCFYVALYATLALRYLEFPDRELWVQHAVPFTYLFGMAVVVYFIAGLYDQHTALLRNKLPQLVAYSQLSIVVLAAMFFFLIPYFGITPKTNLLIFLVLSSVCMVAWRLFLTRFIGVRGRRNALVLGSGSEMDELVAELNANARYGLRIRHLIAPSEVVVSEKLHEQIRRFITAERISVIVIDTRDPKASGFTFVLYDLLFSHPELTILSATQLYEEIFRRIPVSRLEDTWFIEHITRQPPLIYNMYHRTFDIVASLALGIAALALLPFVALAVRLNDRGPVFFYQRRIGKDGHPLDLVKFRTMAGGGPSGGGRVTRIGDFLRKTRIDELPQLWNVLQGGYSLIGPRPEIPEYVARYAAAIPYYSARHLITPGLSGWAQLNHHEHPHHGIDVDETRNKLSYDLYYLKHRSFWLDLEIGLKTIKTLLSVVGK